MKAKHRFIVAVIVLGLLMTGPFVVTSLLVWLDLKDTERDMLTQLLLSRLPVGTIMTLFGFAVGVGVLHKLFKQYVEGLLRMSETLRMMLGANRNFRVTVEGPPEVQQLAQAANDLAQQRDALMDDVDAQIATAKASVEEEKNRLAALMSELAQAVVVWEATSAEVPAAIKASQVAAEATCLILTYDALQGLPRGPRWLLCNSPIRLRADLAAVAESTP